MAVGDALAVAVMLLQTMAVVVEGALDLLLTQGQGQVLDVARQALGQHRQQIAGHRLLVHLGGGDEGKRLGRAAQVDGATRAQQIHCALVVVQGVDVHQGALGRHQQLVIHLFIDDRLDKLLHPAKIQQHAHLVELAAHLDVHQPALPYHAATLAQIAGIDHSQISNK
ncbi:hypothetical protein D3C75_892550 [compost metagenome]